MSDDVLYSVQGPKTLPEMTWAEVSDLLDETDMVIVPVASTEQHGPHLPLATDSIQATEIARRTVARLGEEGITVVAGPTICFGVSPYHMPFPGTINLSSDTLKAVIKEVCQSLYQHGFRRFALLLGHGGNYAVMQVAAQDLVVELADSQFVFLNFLPALREKYPEILASDKEEGHAGEGETARILVTHPNLVDIDRAEEFYSRAAEEAESEDHPLLGGGMYVPVRDWKAVTPYGSVGNPSLATQTAGEESYDVIVEWVAEAIKRSLL